ncbi:hypothetical protein R1flu_000165 [Riccia fluitans]|uniref:Uncharacterized protein n=1 Tax=Riccia fluitans TaxID=41844 RepID=A0ABD1XZP1_9MARC
MKCSKLSLLAPDVLRFLCDALSLKRFTWSKIIHMKFLGEVVRLHGQSLSGRRSPRGKTACGPLMCFLYAHAVLTRSLADLDDLLSFTGEKIMKVSVEFPGEKTRKIVYEGQRHVSRKSEEDGFKQDGSSRMPSAITSLEVATSQFNHSGKRSRLVEQCVPSISLPKDSLTIEGWAANVLELECTIARQNAELAESRLLVFKQGEASCKRCKR